MVNQIGINPSNQRTSQGKLMKGCRGWIMEKSYGGKIMAEKLITYFSASGVTEKKAKELAAITGAEILQIEPEQPYTSADLNWMDKKSRSSREMQDDSSRPAIKNRNVDLSGYSSVYIGFPIWWGIAPKVINTFIDENDLKGKDIVIFATSGGSGISHAVNSLKATYPELRIVRSKLLSGRITEDI